MRGTADAGVVAAGRATSTAGLSRRRGLETTHRSHRRFSLRATGLPWDLTFADAAEEARNDDSGHSQVAITDLGMVLAERLHPKAAYSRCRPFGDTRWSERIGAKPSHARVEPDTV